MRLKNTFSETCPHLTGDIIRYATFEKYDEQIKNTIGYEEFTKGYEYYGFNVQEDNSVMYREWAPNAVTASLVGDFSKYHRGVCWGEYRVCEERLRSRNNRDSTENQKHFLLM